MSGMLALASAPVALAQPTTAAKEAARKDYKAGEAKFAQAQYAAALKLYEAAEATVPIPQTKYKIAVCRDKLGQVPDAIRWYQTFLDSVPPEKAAKLADLITDAKGRLQALQMTPALVRLVVTPPTAKLSVGIDGGPFQSAGPTVALAPGHHRLVFQADGFDGNAAEVDVAPADAKELKVTLQATKPGAVAAAPPPPPGQAAPAQASAAPPADAPHRRSNVPGYVLIGVAGAGIVVGSAFGAIALSDKSSFNQKPTLASANNERTHAMISDISFIVAGALGITGIVLVVTNLPKAGETTGRAYITPYAGPTGAGATAGLSF